MLIRTFFINSVFISTAGLLGAVIINDIYQFLNRPAQSLKKYNSGGVNYCVPGAGIL